MLDESQELKPENGEGSGFGGLHVRNNVTLNGQTNCVFEEAYADTLCGVWCRLP